MEKDEFLNRLVTDLNYTASVAEMLIARPKALREVLKDEKVRKKINDDPVFFAVLMCNDKWLVNAPDHQKYSKTCTLDKWQYAGEDGANP